MDPCLPDLTGTRKKPVAWTSRPCVHDSPASRLFLKRVPLIEMSRIRRPQQERPPPQPSRRRVNEMRSAPPDQTSASRPFLSMRFKSLSDGPLGFFSPISHFWTVETLVFRNAANTA
jgi:hypothetical protein